MMRMTHHDFLEILQLIEPDITPRPIDRSKDPFLRRSIYLPFLCFRLRRSVSSVTISPFSTTSTKATWNVCTRRGIYGYKPLRKRGTHTRAKHVWYGCPNEQNIIHQTREQKKCFNLFDRMFDGLQILSNTTKHDQTAPNNVWWCLVAKHFPFGQA